MSSYRCRGLPAPSVHAIDLVCQVSLDSGQIQPVNILRSCWSRYSCNPRPDHITMTGGGEVPFGTDACAGDWVGDEVMVTEKVKRALIFDIVEGICPV